MAETWRDIVYRRIGHEDTERTPYTLDFEGDVVERLVAHYGGAAWRDRLDSAIWHVADSNLGVDTNCGAPVTTDVFGTTWRIDRRPFHLEEPALMEPSLAGYRFPSLAESLPEGWHQRAVQRIEEGQGHFLVAGFGFGLFERTWTLRGFNEAMMDAAAEPGFYQELVEAIAGHQLEVIEALLTLPVDGIMFSDDWGYQRGVLLGAERWRRFIKPGLRRQYERVHQAGKLTLSHCCGSVTEIMPDLIEIGLDVLESIQPEAMDPYFLKRQYGRDITLWGGLGSQSTIPFGTPEGIRAEVQRLCAEMGQGGGFILASAKALQPETPTANAAAVVESFIEAGG